MGQTDGQPGGRTDGRTPYRLHMRAVSITVFTLSTAQQLVANIFRIHRVTVT